MKTVGKTSLTSRAARAAARPFVLVNMAMSADGKIATANRAVSTFSSPRDHDHLYELRATADAVMCGARTVDLNRVTLGPGAGRFRKLRLQRGLAAHNLRIIVTGSGSLDVKAEVFRHHFSPIVILTSRRASALRRRRLSAIADEVKVCGAREIDFATALPWLRQKWGVRRLLCEGGGELNDALFRAGLVDELHLTICPTIIGGRAAPTIADGLGCSELALAARFELHSRKRHGHEMFLVFRRRKKSPSKQPSRRC